MKRILLIIGAGSILSGILFFAFLKVRIGRDVKANIELAKGHYPGTAEDALIAYLTDESNSPRNRSQIAIWTLGRIKSEKALPVLQGLYRDDPLGETCYGKHDSVLCQYELHKAMTSIEKFRIFSYPKLR